MNVHKLWSFFLLVTIGCLLGAIKPNIARAAELGCPDILPSTWIGRETLVLQNRGDRAEVYFPTPPPDLQSSFEDAFPVVAMLQGAGVDKSHYEEFGVQLARFGFVVVIPNRLQLVGPPPPVPFPDQFVIMDVLAQMQLEDADPSSPLFGIVDTGRMGIAGHSAGGAVGLFAIDGRCEPPFCFGPPFFPLPPVVRAGAFYGTNTFNPFPPFELIDVDTTGIPVALVQGSLDSIATPAEARATVDILDGPKALVSIQGANHYGICDVNNPLGAIPDFVPPTISQTESVQQVAWAMGEFFLTHVKGNPADSDGDGIPNAADNCPVIPNPDQTDVNNDGFGDVCISPETDIADGVEIGCGVIIRAGVRIKTAAWIQDFAQIDQGVRINNRAVVGSESTIGSNSRLIKDVSIGERVRIGSNVTIRKKIVIPDDTVIPDGTTVD